MDCEDLLARRAEGADWRQHMILLRASWAGRAIEMKLIERKIPYQYIGGTALLQSAHIKDALSVLRIVANNEDELAWGRYLRLWPGIGEVTANRIVEKILDKPNLPEILNTLAQDTKAGGAAGTRLISSLPKQLVLLKRLGHLPVLSNPCWPDVTLPIGTGADVISCWLKSLPKGIQQFWGSSRNTYWTLFMVLKSPRRPKTR